MKSSGLSSYRPDPRKRHMLYRVVGPSRMLHAPSAYTTVSAKTFRASTEAMRLGVSYSAVTSARASGGEDVDVGSADEEIEYAAAAGA